MPTLKEWILKEASDELIEGVVIGQMGWGDYGKEKVPGYDDHPRGMALTWAEAEKHLQYEFDDGYGAPGCEAVYAWTKSWVIFVQQYDGATHPDRIPRNPMDVEPEMPGG